MEKAIVAYIPVLHKGYISFIERQHPDRIYLVTPEFVLTLDEELGGILGRDMELRSIGYSSIAYTLSEKYRIPVSVLETEDLERRDAMYIFLHEDVSAVIVQKHGLTNVVYDNWFVRFDWGKTNIPKDVTGEYPISTDEKDRYFMSLARIETEKSSDFWRQVGAAVPIGNRVITGYNRHRPDPANPYVYGDMRMYMKKGEKPEICGALHAEKSIISQIARSKDLSSSGASIYVTTYPCGDCARAIEEAGFKKVFFSEPYANLDAEIIFQKASIEVIQVL